VIRSSHLPQEKRLVLQQRLEVFFARCIPVSDILNAAKNTLRNLRPISVLGVALAVVASGWRLIDEISVLLCNKPVDGYAEVGDSDRSPLL